MMLSATPTLYRIGDLCDWFPLESTVALQPADFPKCAYCCAVVHNEGLAKALRPNPSFHQTLNLNVEAVEKPFFGRIVDKEMARISRHFASCF
jgi:hypothetical protein